MLKLVQRLGMIRVPKSLIENNEIYTILELLELQPTSIDQIYMNDTYAIVGISPHFRLKEIGGDNIVQEYSFKINYSAVIESIDIGDSNIKVLPDGSK